MAETRMPHSSILLGRCNSNDSRLATLAGHGRTLGYQIADEEMGSSSPVLLGRLAPQKKRGSTAEVRQESSIDVDPANLDALAFARSARAAFLQRRERIAQRRTFLADETLADLCAREGDPC